MTTYIIKRLLLMIPTLFVISLVIFLVLNLAPGRPGGAQASAEGTQTASSAEARESYRIFKEQFNFDKPIMLNTRYALGDEEVEAKLEILADYARPVCPAAGEGEAATVENCIPAEEKPSSAAIIEAQEIVEDWGRYIVPHLVRIGRDHERLDVRILAVQTLSANAGRRLINEYGKDQTPEQRAYNREVFAENERLSSWIVPPDAEPQAVASVLQEKWLPWYEERAEVWDYDFAEKLEILFFDTRFAKYWGNLASMNFGVSHVDKQPVIERIMQKVPYTLTLNFVALIIAYFLSIPLGVWSAYYQNSTADRVVTVLLFMLYSLPSFFVGVLLLKWFAAGEPFDWFPTGGFAGSLPTWAQPDAQIQTTADMTILEYFGSVGFHLALPVFCMTYGALASLSRYARTGLLDVIRADYIRTARAKGLSEPMVIIKHAVRNGMIPILTLIGTLLPALISGSVVIEVIFNIPGMGLYLFESIFARDYNAIMGVLLISTVLTLVGLLISDISYAVVDPRISFD